jgi:hypothetical protein
MNLVMTRFKIDGLSPLLQHSPKGMSVGSNGPKTKKIPTAEEDARNGLYLTSKNEVYMPTVAFRSALLAACVGKKFGKQTAWKIMGAAVMLFSEETVITGKDGKPYVEDKKEPVNYVIDTRRVIVVRAGIMRSRPRFDDWHCEVIFSLDTDLLEDPKIVEELLNEAGTTVGVGDFRVEKKGLFGRFTAKLIEDK